MGKNKQWVCLSDSDGDGFDLSGYLIDRRTVDASLDSLFYRMHLRDLSEKVEEGLESIAKTIGFHRDSVRIF